MQASPCPSSTALALSFLLRLSWSPCSQGRTVAERMRHVRGQSGQANMHVIRKVNCCAQNLPGSSIQRLPSIQKGGRVGEASITRISTGRRPALPGAFCTLPGAMVQSGPRGNCPTGKTHLPVYGYLSSPSGLSCVTGQAKGISGKCYLWLTSETSPLRWKPAGRANVFVFIGRPDNRGQKVKVTSIG